MIGIYKITNPKGRIYIGQSVDIERRFKSYKNIKQNKSQIKLYNSLKKYKYNSHIFETLEICDIKLLNERERYYQEFYNSIIKGLNCRFTKTNDKSGKLSEQTKLKISKSNKNKIVSNETRLKISIAKKGKKLSKEHIEKIKLGNKGKILTDEHKKLLSSLRKNERKSNVGKKGKEHKQARSVICTKTNKIWNTITECALELNISVKNLSRYLNGTRKNKTTIIYLSNE